MAQVSKYTNSYSKKCHIIKFSKISIKTHIIFKKNGILNILTNLKLFFSKSTLKLQLLIKYNLQIQFLTYKPNI